MEKVNRECNEFNRGTKYELLQWLQDKNGAFDFMYGGKRCSEYIIVSRCMDNITLQKKGGVRKITTTINCIDIIICPRNEHISNYFCMVEYGMTHRELSNYVKQAYGKMIRSENIIGSKRRCGQPRELEVFVESANKCVWACESYGSIVSLIVDRFVFGRFYSNTTAKHQNEFIQTHYPRNKTHYTI